MMVSMMMTMVGRSLCLSEFPQLTDMPVIADEGFVDYDSDYDMKAENGRAPATSVDPYAGQ